MCWAASHRIRRIMSDSFRSEIVVRFSTANPGLPFVKSRVRSFGSDASPRPFPFLRAEYSDTCRVPVPLSVSRCRRDPQYYLRFVYLPSVVREWDRGIGHCFVMQAITHISRRGL